METLRDQGYEVQVSSSGLHAITDMQRNTYDIIVTDLFMPDISGLDLLAHVTENHPDTEVIILTGYGTVENAVQAMKRGAFDYLIKPAKIEELLCVLKRVQDIRDLKEENLLLRTQIEENQCFHTIIGESVGIQKVFNIIRRVSGTDSTVLITGESGTGKELIAQAVHHRSHRRTKPFVPINCGAIPEELLESELFGHERGAFTGALKEHRGRFELAHKGTVFLDEIGEMSAKLQVKLLRFLQERNFQRIGGSRTVEVDVRILAATNKDLEEAVAANEFRKDLYYRLNVIPIHVPPLRERDGDVPLLAHHLLKLHCDKKAIPPKRLSASAMECLEDYQWPGNVRELENVVERLVILTEADEIQRDDLPRKMRTAKRESPFGKLEIGMGIDLKGILSEVENQLINEALQKAGGIKNKAAKLLGLNRTTLVEKLKKKDFQASGMPCRRSDVQA
jgi:DNA-binding NtrC family response regulator